MNFLAQTPMQSDEILVFLTRAILYYQLKPVVSVFGCCNDGDGDNDDGEGDDEDDVDYDKQLKNPKIQSTIKKLPGLQKLDAFLKSL